MKNLKEFLISESKQKPLYDDYDVRCYIERMLCQWVESMRGYDLIFAGTDLYAKKNLCRKTEVIISIIEALSSIVHFYFRSEDDEKYNGCTLIEDDIVRAFRVIEAVINMKVDTHNKVDSENDIDINKEISDLHDRVAKLVDKCNKEYKSWKEQMNKEDYDKCGCCASDSCCEVPCCSKLGLSY